MLLQSKTSRGFELLELFCKSGWDVLTVIQDSVVLDDKLIDTVGNPGSSALVIGESRFDRRTVLQLVNVLAGWLMNGRLHGHVKPSKSAEKLRAAIMHNKECPVCKQVPRDHFMLIDAVWAEAGFTHDQVACLSCVALVLNRSMQASDFTKCPLNNRWLAIFGVVDA